VSALKSPAAAATLRACLVVLHLFVYSYIFELSYIVGRVQPQNDCLGFALAWLNYILYFRALAYAETLRP
jgi:hypothetical protein